MIVLFENIMPRGETMMKKELEENSEKKEESVWMKGISIAIPLLIFLKRLFPAEGSGTHWFYLLLAIVLLCGTGIAVYRLVQKLRADRARDVEPFWEQEQTPAAKRFWPIAGSLISAVILLMAALFSLTVFLGMPLNELLSGQVTLSDLF